MSGRERASQLTRKFALCCAVACWYQALWTDRWLMGRFCHSRERNRSPSSRCPPICILYILFTMYPTDCADRTLASRSWMHSSASILSWRDFLNCTNIIWERKSIIVPIGWACNWKEEHSPCPHLIMRFDYAALSQRRDAAPVRLISWLTFGLAIRKIIASRTLHSTPPATLVQRLFAMPFN